ncbi:hypothetical protein FISHEDRAFT_66418 [Fistulina hepatica ATCC 64428]|uniref:mRNA stability protein n=1 Tax=Fistulina hepatica ATCC 64428 TaxID=1128425 RepID=A0A0D7A6D6_9AGAR|nr:hypothetical protein FISHEDRAFT_66418 [Fistulina hepatica ATCC 64428]
MLPRQRNKIDMSKLSDQEKLLISKYGKLPTHKNVLMKMQKDRKYFDSGDYALSKAGVAPQSTVGTAIPNPNNIPHANPQGNHANGLSTSPTNSTSPIREDNDDIPPKSPTLLSASSPFTAAEPAVHSALSSSVEAISAGAE